MATAAGSTQTSAAVTAATIETENNGLVEDRWEAAKRAKKAKELVEATVKAVKLGKALNKDDVVISEDAAKKVLTKMFGELPDKITDEDRAFAQRILAMAIDSSGQMGIINIAFDVFFNPAKINSLGTVSEATVKIITKAIDREFEIFVEGKSYSAVNNVISRNWRTEYRNRLENNNYSSPLINK
jgi:hypothetical protein